MLFLFAENLKQLLEQAITPTPQVLILPAFTSTETSDSPLITIELLPRDWQEQITVGTPGQRYFKQLCQVSLQLSDSIDYQPLADQISAVLIARQQELIESVPTREQAHGQHTVQEVIESVLLQTTGLSTPSAAAQQESTNTDHQPSTLYWQLQVTGMYNVALPTAADYMLSRVDVTANGNQSSETGEPDTGTMPGESDDVPPIGGTPQPTSGHHSVINYTVSSNLDLNSVRETGVYAISTDNPNLPTDLPDNSHANILTVYLHGSDSGVQILRSADSNSTDSPLFTYQRSWYQQSWTDWQQVLSINNQGKVGIGTLEPTANLEIQGDLKLNSGAAVDQFSTDGALAGNRDTAAPTEKAVKTYADTELAKKAKLAGDPGQNFETWHMTAHSDATVHGGLRVNGLAGQGVKNYHYMNHTHVGHYFWDSGNVISIHAQHRVAASEFMAFSDRRIKRDFSPTDSREDLQKLNQLELINYHYIDRVGHSGAQQKKLIAQQVEEIYPQAVTRSEDFIPNIYQLSVDTDYDESVQQLRIVLDVEHDLFTGCEVRLITDSGQQDHKVLEVINAYSFVVSSEVALSDVFVFGKKVNDFRHIDYTAISMLGVSATQQLSQENQRLREETEQLRQLLEAYSVHLETQSARLDALEKKCLRP